MADEPDKIMEKVKELEKEKPLTAEELLDIMHSEAEREKKIAGMLRKRAGKKPSKDSVSSSK